MPLLVISHVLHCSCLFKFPVLLKLAAQLVLGLNAPAGCCPQCTDELTLRCTWIRQAVHAVCTCCPGGAPQAGG